MHRQGKGGVKDFKVLIQTVNEHGDVCAFLRVSTVTHLWLVTFAACARFTGHTSDEAVDLYPNLPEDVDTMRLW